MGNDLGGPDLNSTDLGHVWALVIEDLRRDDTITDTLLGFVQLTTPLAIAEDTLLLVAPDDLTKRMVETRVCDQVLRRVGHHLGTQLLRLAVTIDPGAATELVAARAAMAKPIASESATTPVTSPETQAAAPRTATPRQTSAQITPPPKPNVDPALSPTDPGDRTVELRENPPGFGGRRQFADADADGSPATDPGSQASNGSKGALSIATGQLNPKYTFETFVTGASNRFASAAACAVAEAPAQAYNPLFIYGHSGLGKTHLLHAIGHYASHLFNEVRVRFVNSEEFTNDFINTIGEGGGTELFHRRYRDVDILLIDDIQFLQGKVQTQEEFFHTFNALHNANKQIVITSDVAPRLLAGFEDRMRSRFESGLLTDVQPPDLETRIAILRKKASAEKLNVPYDVLEYIASMIATNIRELEGALIRVTAFANLNAQPISVALAQMIMAPLIGKQDHEVTPAAIIAHTCAVFGVSVQELTGPSRTRQLTTARQIAMYLCREMTSLSLPKIGQAFGGRDHTTVIHADRKIRQLMAQKHAIYSQVNELTNRIRQNPPV